MEPPKVVRGADGKEYLTASFERLYTGNEYKISVWCVLDNHDKGADNYLYWDGIAQAQDRSGSAVSNVYRLWYKDGEGTAPTPSGYQLSYAFAGELPPDAVVPAGGVYADGTEVTAAQKPASQYGYYTFTGWVRSDTGKEVTPGDKFDMPGSNLTLTGTWTINREQAPTVTVQYQYNKEIPGAPELPGSVQVLVGENHSIMSIQNDEYYHSFAGWTPTLTIGGKPVNLTPGPNGYTGTHGKTTLVISSTGVLTTEQFRNLAGADSTVEITYTGKWNPYSGTIHFDPNGASGQVASLRNVTWDTDQVLPEGKGALTHPSAAYQFVGWTGTVDGTDVKQPGASAKGIITQNNQEVKMFAKWSRSVFDVVYQLSQVTSTNTARQADLNSKYTTTLQAAPGWAIDTVQVAMNGMTLTGVYNQDTGEISIPAVTGDIIITATARQNGGGSGGGSGTRYTLRYQSNGGTAYPEERYAPGTVVRLTKAPTREGCTFTGWYEDPELTQKITQVTMNSSKTVYAGWKVTGIPGWLNGTDHFAYVSGYPDGTVKPLNKISRAEVAAIFFRLLQADIRQDKLTGESPFADVRPETWYNTAVSTMANLGILVGREPDAFVPAAPITRAEFAVICSRFDKDQQDGNSDFSDISSHWAKEEIERAATLGWIQGYSDGTFRPDNHISRAEAVTMINRVLQRLPEKKEDLLEDMTRWPDNPENQWYYLAMQEATNSHDYARKKDGVFESWMKLTPDPDWSQYE